MRQGIWRLWTHPSLFINKKLSPLNPHNVQKESFATQLFDATALEGAIRDLCAGGHPALASTTPR